MSRPDLDALLDHPAVIEYHETGSRAITYPGRAADFDWCLFIHPGMLRAMVTTLRALGYQSKRGQGYPESYLSTFYVLNWGDTDLILTDDRIAYDRWEAATLLARERKADTKLQRVLTFQRVVYGKIVTDWRIR